MSYNRITPYSFTIDFVNRGQNKLIDNAKCVVCLQMANIDIAEWHMIDRTGNVIYEERVDDKLRHNNLTDEGTRTIKINK